MFVLIYGVITPINFGIFGIVFMLVSHLQLLSLLAAVVLHVQNPQSHRAENEHSPAFPFRLAFEPRFKRYPNIF